MTLQTRYKSVFQFCYDQHRMIWYEPTAFVELSSDL